VGDKIKDYTSDTDDNVKRWDMSNVNTSWKRSQVVAATGTVGAGIDFLEKHFDIVFAKNHEDGKKMSPLLLLMSSWLKNLYICKLQEIHRSKRKLNNEVDKLLAKEHYVTKDIGIIKTDNMEEF